MPRRSKRRVIASTQDDDEGGNHIEEVVAVSRQRRRRGQAVATNTNNDEDDEVDVNEHDNLEDDGRNNHDDDEDVQEVFGFSQQAPEASQGVLPERPHERRNLDGMDQTKRDKALLSLSRTILFKAMDREPIDRTKIPKELGFTDRIATAAFQEAKDRLRNVFGFELNSVPNSMAKKKDFPARFTNRYYLVNEVADFENGSHSKTIHSIHTGPAIEKGFLLLSLALIFCKGESRADGSRWILARDLYRLLHDVDESIPEEPPAQGTARASKAGLAGAPKVGRLNNTHWSPNADVLLEQFVNWDYLIREKATDENFPSQTLEEGDVLYTMGPRAALEVGRKQIIYFCAEILDEGEPDPSMLKELEEQEDDGDEGEEPAADYMEATQ